MFQVATAGWGLIAVSTTKSDGACGIAAHPCKKRKDGAALGIVASSGTDSNHYKFTGKERDSESNLDNFGARYYTSNIGRFMTPDWAARATAVPYATFGDPQTLNLYTYVRNDPVSQADADGHQVGYRDATGTSCPACPSALQQIEDANDDRYNDEQEAKAEGQARAQQSGTAQNQVTFSDTKTTHSYDEKTNTETTTTVTTSVTLSTAKGHEGEFVGAGVTTSTHTNNYETGEKSDKTGTTALNFAQATRAAGGAENMARIRDAVTPGLGSHFASITAQDARAHPYKYAGAAASAAISVIDPPATIGAAVRALVPAVLGLLDSTTGP